MPKKSFQTVACVVLLVLFFLSEFVFYGTIGSLSPYATYYVEIAFIVVTAFVLDGFEIRKTNENTKLVPILMLLAIFGFGIRALCGTLSLNVPFDLNSTETLLFLLLLGPIIEEVLFRGALAGLIKSLKAPDNVQLAITSLAFAYAHFIAYYDSPSNYHPFILYQTAYTFILGLTCGYVALRRGLLYAILGHIVVAPI